MLTLFTGLCCALHTGAMVGMPSGNLWAAMSAGCAVLFGLATIGMLADN